MEEHAGDGNERPAKRHKGANKDENARGREDETEGETGSAGMRRGRGDADERECGKRRRGSSGSDIGTCGPSATGRGREEVDTICTASLRPRPAASSAVPSEGVDVSLATCTLHTGLVPPLLTASLAPPGPAATKTASGFRQGAISSRGGSHDKQPPFTVPAPSLPTMPRTIVDDTPHTMRDAYAPHKEEGQARVTALMLVAPSCSTCL